MPSQYDKLGSLLSEALKEEKIPQYSKKNHNFSTKLLKQQYHALLKEYHPDSNKEYNSKQNISSIKINEIKNAYTEIIKWYDSEGYEYFD